MAARRPGHHRRVSSVAELGHIGESMRERGDSCPGGAGEEPEEEAVLRLDKEGGDLEQVAGVIKVLVLGEPRDKLHVLEESADGARSAAMLFDTGVAFLELPVALRGTHFMLSFWAVDEEDSSSWEHLCADSVAVLMVFDLRKPSTLRCMKHLYRLLRKSNKFAVPLLVGINYCQFCDKAPEDRTKIVSKARKCARAMKCPLLFCDSEPLINVTKLYTVLLQSVLSLPLCVEEEHDPEFPLVECTPAPVPLGGSCSSSSSPPGGDPCP